MPFCNVIIYSYHYLLDPKIAERVSRELSKDCIVVFDEAHNIDNVCIEALSIDLTEDSLRKATRGAGNLERKIADLKESDAQKLQDEYQKLVEGLREADEARNEEAFMANPGPYLLVCRIWLTIAALPDDLLKEAVPGNIRRAEHFVSFLKRFIEYLKVCFGTAAGANTNRSDPNESPSCHIRDTTIVLDPLERTDIHREKAAQVLRRAVNVPCPHTRAYEHRRLPAASGSGHVCHAGSNLRGRVSANP
jgi:DNA excision repair protein ERCC-2